MELYLQLGHGMMEHCKELISKWNSGTAILSPKNMDLKQMKTLSSNLNANNGSVLIDPQFYIPRSSQKKLYTHSFWPNDFNTNLFFNGSGINSMIDLLIQDYVLPTNSSAFIIPSLYMSDLNNDWTKITDIILNTVEKQFLSIPKYLTICVGENILSNETKTHELIELIQEYPVDGYYLIPIHPKDSYLVDNTSWLINLLDLVASLKVINKKVIVGYCSHQLLLLSLAKVDVIASGIWMKTRMFPLGDFDENDEESNSRRSTWYYCPQALSEYQIQFLDIAHRVGILNDLKVAESFNTNYADILFQGAQPTTLNFSEREGFRHYLDCLHIQCHDVSKGTYEDTKTYLKLICETGSELSNYFHQNGVRAKHRDFSNIADCVLAVIDAFDNLWGLKYHIKWDSIL